MSLALGDTASAGAGPVQELATRVNTTLEEAQAIFSSLTTGVAAELSSQLSDLATLATALSQQVAFLAEFIKMRRAGSV